MADLNDFARPVMTDAYQDVLDTLRGNINRVRAGALPIAGGTMTGNLAVTGNISATGEIAAAGALRANGGNAYIAALASGDATLHFTDEAGIDKALARWLRSSNTFDLVGSVTVNGNPIWTGGSGGSFDPTLYLQKAGGTMTGSLLLAADGVAGNEAVTVAQLALKVNLALLGVPSGVATLDSSGKLTPSQIPTSLSGTYLPLAGGTMTGALHLAGPAATSDEPVTLAQLSAYVPATPTTQMSITSDASGLKLVGDALSPAISMYYGTDAAGTKGWWKLTSTTANLWLYTALTTGTTATDPGQGHIKWNNASQIAATALYVDSLTKDGIDIDLFIGRLQTNSILYLQEDNDNSNYQLWKLTAPPTDNSGWWTFPVTLVRSAGTGTTNFVNTKPLIATVSPPGGSLITPGGSDTYVQFNDGGAFGGSSGLTYNKTSTRLTSGGGITISGTLPSVANATRSVDAIATVPASATTQHVSYRSYPTTAAAAFAVASLVHFYADQFVQGVGSSVTEHTGFLAGMSANTVTNKYGFRGTISAGTNYWNLYMDGTAANYIAGSLGVGDIPSAFTKLTVAGTLPESSTASGGIAISGATVPATAVFATMFSSGATNLGTLTEFSHYAALNAFNSGAGSIANQYGFRTNDLLRGTTANYGFYGGLTAGTGKWNFYANGSAANYFAGQVAVGSNTLDASALLALASTTQGLLFPRMTTTQKNAISSPTEGLVVYDATTHALSVRGASAWADLGAGGGGGSSSVVVDTFSGTGTQTAFTLSQAPGNVANTFVFFNGVYQNKANFSVSGTTLTFATAPALGTSNIQVVSFSSISAGVAAAGSLTGTALAPQIIVPPNQLGPFVGPLRNALINGNLEVWQRGTSFATIGATDPTYTADRWCWRNSGSARATITRDASVPTVAQAGALIPYSLKVACTTAQASPASGDYVLLQQKIEGYTWRKFWQRALALSFWVRSTQTGTYAIALQSGGTDRYCVMTYTISAANTWERKEVAFPASPSAGTWDVLTGVGALLAFTMSSGSTLTGSGGSWQTGAGVNVAGTINVMNGTSSTWQVAAVQLEVGLAASEFEDVPFPENLRRCSRYYTKTFAYGTVPAQNSGDFDGIHVMTQATNSATAGSYNGSQWPVPMRAAPVLVTFNPSAANASARNFTQNNDCGVPTTAADFRAWRLNFTSATTSGQGNMLLVHATADAEL